ncbi:DUF421 domain-containing protein [Nonomuraea sp. LP-02]|uniref:DUF421 domain-containing protein n=1 Tax=Nonomuraea sp. LP-02 TaxID=3097960 RepID=UPI002E37C218|nr:YetF domain-containing protein [Nonomuraea sp. LP-02]MED7927123.1 DUF421 domain-containing protein [Nonomuraea sp. LP-02]
MRIGLTWTDAGTVVLSTVVIYLAFLVLIRIAGPRALATMSSFDLAAAVALGAVMGRAVLGYTPTLLAGLIGMCTLFALQTGFRLLRRNSRLECLMSNAPLLLMADGAVLHDSLRKAQINEDELRQKLRLASVHRYGDVAAVILERTGDISVLRRGEAIDPEFLSDVKGCDRLRPGHSGA